MPNQVCLPIKINPPTKRLEIVEPETKQECDNLTLLNERELNRSDQVIVFSLNSRQSQRRIKSEYQMDFDCHNNLFHGFNNNSNTDEFEANNLSMVHGPKEEWGPDLSLINDNQRIEPQGIRREYSKHISKMNSVSMMRVGVKRRQGAGRKTVNPEMERTVIQWVLGFISSYRRLIRNNA